VSLLISSFTIGLILALLALGVLISFRILHRPDITAEGSITLGAAVSAMLLMDGWSPAAATGAGILAGMVAGAVTGLLHTGFKINSLLSGILVMTALYSIDLHIMGRSNVPLSSATTFVTQSEAIVRHWFGGVSSVRVWGWDVPVRDLSVLGFVLVNIPIVGLAMYGFFRTDLGTAMRATGDNSQMVRALGVNDGRAVVIGLALSNGLIAMAGALLAQYQGFADVQMGLGMIVWGLASVILGEALVGTGHLGYAIIGTVMGSVLFRLLVAIALRWGLNPNDLKLITAAFVLAALILPDVLARIRVRKAGARHA
jgi:putative tryptophan/tyrosine transport system permease protein